MDPPGAKKGGFMTFEFDQKTRELIAIGASIAAGCEPCLKYHFAEAKKAGCSQEEMKAAATLACMIKERPVSAIYELADNLIGLKEGDRQPCCGGNAGKKGCC